MTRAALLLSVCLLVPATAEAKKDKPPKPLVLDFEADEVGKPATDWHGPQGTGPQGEGTAGYRGVVSDVTPHGGKRALMLESIGSPDWGATSYHPDPAPYRGKVIRFRAWLRYEGKGKAGAWLRVDRPKGGPRGFFANTEGHPITSATWERIELVGEVADDAEKILTGALIWGEGKAWIDDVTIEVVDVPPPEGPSPLAGRALDNVVAFSKLLGYVRHFHPSDQAAATDWNQFAIAGVRSVEKAKDAKALVKALDKLFAPVAPGLQIFVGEKAPKPAAPPKGATRVTWWEHNGFGQGDADNAYTSERKWAALKDGKLPDEAPVHEPLVLDLGGGVSVRLPVVLYGDDKGTLPRTKPGKPAEAGYTRAEDRSTRLAAVVLAWNIFQHFFPYFDVVGTDWGPVLPETLADAADAADAAAYYRALARMVAKLHDGHGYVAGKGAPSMEQPARPPVNWDIIEDKLVVTAVAGDAGGLKPGDVIVTIDGKAPRDLMAAEEETISASTPQNMRWSAVRTLGRGVQGSAVEIEFERGGTRTKVSLTRSASVWELPQEKRPDVVAEVQKGVMYVDLDRVTEKQWEEALPRLAKAKGVILDMRGYPKIRPYFLKHFTDKSIDSAQWNVPLVTKPDRIDFTFTNDHWSIDPAEPRIRGKVAFLTDGRAISQAETDMGIVEHYKLGFIVGEATAGTNGNINPFAIPGGYYIGWTGMKVLKHDGSRHHGVGILPTHPVARTIAGVAAGRDEILQAACRLVEK